eukprot:13013122-Alexandrium_andersonii.AAC.1
MSASLVGSEMCIRDRSCPAAAANKTHELGPPKGLAEALRLACCRGGSVSYTHLTLPTICSV